MGDDEQLRVFVSRIPAKWTAELMTEHFQTLGMDATGAEIFTSKRAAKVPSKRGAGNLCYQWKNEGRCDHGDGCRFAHSTTAGAGGEDEGGAMLSSGAVWFASAAGVEAALALGTMHVGHRTVKISPFCATDDGRDTTACYAFARFCCSRGDDCRFSHQGPGGCVVVGEPRQGRKFQCLSWKSKGKCSKGDACLFLHAARGGGEGGGGGEHAAASKPKKAGGAGACRNWAKWGKCKRGEDCPFLASHGPAVATEVEAAPSAAAPKKRKIDGNALVELRRQAKAAKTSGQQ